jgi:hypothetical protein
MKHGSILLLAFLSMAAGAWAAADCVSCHTEKATVKDSIHGSIGCTGCHSTIQSYPHPEKQTPVNCASCHSAPADTLAKSVHAVSGGPTCLSCHGGAHEILPSKNPQSTTNPANLPRTCATCHGNEEAAKRVHAPQVYAMYMDSIHGFALMQDGLLVAANCSSCHGSHGILSKKDPKSKTNRANIPATCGVCHGGPLRAFSAGIHGQLLEAGAAEGPVCTSCHTAHEITKVGSPEWQMKTTATCGSCHKEQFATYRDTFHAQVSSLGYQQTARCWDCHGFHEILPASDPKSMVAPDQLVRTCGKCHSGANASFVKYDPHADSHDQKRYPALHYSAIFMNMLLAGTLGFFLLHTILWFLRSHFGPKPEAESK